MMELAPHFHIYVALARSLTLRGRHLTPRGGERWMDGWNGKKIDEKTSLDGALPISHTQSSNAITDSIEAKHNSLSCPIQSGVCEGELVGDGS